MAHFTFPIAYLQVCSNRLGALFHLVIEAWAKFLFLLFKRAEQSIAEPQTHATVDEEEYTVSYKLVEQGTKRARTKLADSDGYTDKVKMHRANATCSVFT